MHEITSAAVNRRRVSAATVGPRSHFGIVTGYFGIVTDGWNLHGSGLCYISRSRWREIRAMICSKSAQVSTPRGHIKRRGTADNAQRIGNPTSIIAAERAA